MKRASLVLLLAVVYSLGNYSGTDNNQHATFIDPIVQPFHEEQPDDT